MDAPLIGGIIGGVLCCLLLLALLIVLLVRRRRENKGADHKQMHDGDSASPAGATLSKPQNDYASTSALTKENHYDLPPPGFGVGVYDSPPSIDNSNYTKSTLSRNDEYSQVVNETIYV